MATRHIVWKQRAVAAEKSVSDQHLQDQIDEVKQHYGNQPQRIEMKQSGSWAAPALFGSPAAVHQAAQVASSIPTPTNVMTPSNVTPGSGSSGSNSSRMPIPWFQDPTIGTISGAWGDLGFLAQAIMNIGRSSDKSRASRKGTSISNKCRKLNAKQEYLLPSASK